MKGQVAVALFSGALALGGIVTASCTIFDGAFALPSDAGVADGDATSGTDGGDGCMHVPPPPLATGLPDGDKGEFVVIVRELRFSSDLDAGVAPIGFDLDNACTCIEGAGAGECKPKNLATACDDPGGIDNMFGRLVGSLDPSLFDVVGAANAGIAAGDNGVLMRLESWNGSANDDYVRLAILPTLGAGALVDGGVEPSPPSFTKADSWVLDDEETIVNATDITKSGAKEVGEGSIRDGIVVVRMTETITIMPELRLRVQQAFVRARLDTSGPDPILSDLVISGRWPVASALGSVGLLDSTRGRRIGGRLCTSTLQADRLALDFVRAGVCEGLDLLANAQGDPNAPCNALSFGVRMVTAPARIGEHARRSEPVPTCTSTCP